MAAARSGTSPQQSPPPRAAPPAEPEATGSARDDHEPSVLAALGELEVAHEELRAAEEEVRHQRAEIDGLVAEHVRGQAWRDYLMALLPVGVLRTDAEGVVRETNAAAPAMLEVAPRHFVGKPLPSFVEVADRRRVRLAMLRLGRDATEERVTVMLRPRKQPAREVDLVGIRHAGDPDGHLRWVIVPRDLLRSRTPTEATADGPPREAEGAPAADDDLATAAAIARLYTLPLEESEQHRWFTELAVAIRSAVPAADAVSLTLGSPAAPEQVASDSAEAQHVDGLQYRLGEGPCVEAYEREALVVVPDLRHDPRWPRLAAAAQAERVRSALAVPVRVNDQRAGVVNLYAWAPGVFGQRTARVVEIVAAALAAVLEATGERASLRALVHHLERALDSRATIEQAKGVVLAHHGGTPDEAFARLVAYSSRHNVKLRELAARIVEGRATGAISGL